MRKHYYDELEDFSARLRMLSQELIVSFEQKNQIGINSR